MLNHAWVRDWFSDDEIITAAIWIAEDAGELTPGMLDKLRRLAVVKHRERERAELIGAVTEKRNAVRVAIG